MASRLTRGMESHQDERPNDRRISRVVLYGRESAHMDAIRTHGLALIERDGQADIVHLEVTSDPAELRNADVVFVFVKSWATAEAVAPLMPHLASSTRVITLQNGLGNAAALKRALAKPDGTAPHILIGVTTQAAIRTAPGQILHTSDGVTAIGRMEMQTSEHLTAIAAAMRDNGWRTQAVADIHRWVWRKLAVNAAINPLTALAHVPNSALNDDHELRLAAMAVIDEVIVVAAAQQIRLNREQIEQLLGAVARHEANPFSSMYDDLQAGRQTEIDAINGAIVRAGQRSNVATPLNTMVLRLMHARQRALGIDGSRG